MVTVIWCTVHTLHLLRAHQVLTANTLIDSRRVQTGIQLIDRNDELCILYEKSNIHQSIFKQGDEVMKGKEDELRVIKNDQAEMRRKIEVARKNIPSLSVYASTTRTLEAVEQQLEQERALTRELCAKLENPTGTDGEARYVREWVNA